MGEDRLRRGRNGEKEAGERKGEKERGGKEGRFFREGEKTGISKQRLWIAAFLSGSPKAGVQGISLKPFLRERNAPGRPVFRKPEVCPERQEENGMIAFFIGVLTGGCLGITFLCLLKINRMEEKEEEGCR